MHDKATHQCVSCDLCSLVIHILITVSDTHAYAFAISVTSICKYVCMLKISTGTQRNP